MGTISRPYALQGENQRNGYHLPTLRNKQCKISLTAFPPRRQLVPHAFGRNDASWWTNQLALLQRPQNLLRLNPLKVILPNLP